MFGRWRPLILTLLVMVLTALTAPQEGDLIELQGLVNARAEAKFRVVDANKKYVLQKGTKAQVEEVKFFPSTGNYGLRIRPVNADGLKSDDSTSLWVYYKVKNPALKLYALEGGADERARLLAQWEKDPKVKALEVHEPEAASDAVVVKETPALAAETPAPEAAPAAAEASDPNLPATAPAPSEKPADGGLDQQLDQKDADNVVGDIAGINGAVKQAQPGPVCADCAKTPAQYESCDGGNNYLENAIDKLINTAMVNQTLNTSLAHPGLEACVRESMKISGGPFARCDLEESPQRTSRRACLSQKMVKLVQNGFSLAFDCMAEGINPTAFDDKVRRDMSRSAIALVNLESGFLMNAYSPTRAAGLGQFTQGTANSMTRNYWDDIEARIKAAPNAACAELGRMNLKPYGGEACDRLTLEGGNPVVGVLYTLAYMKSLRNDIEPALKRSLREAGIKVSAVFYEELLGALANWGHNTGSMGISRPFASLVETEAGRKALQSGDLAQAMKLLAGEVKSFTYYYEKSRSRGKRTEKQLRNRAAEASAFYSNVQKKLKKVEGKVGRECSL